jgi:hypothetical protein
MVVDMLILLGFGLGGDFVLGDFSVDFTEGESGKGASGSGFDGE